MSRYYGDAPAGLYRSRNGVLAGVCAGVAEYFDLSVFWLRVIMVFAFVLTGFFPVVFLYVLMALLMKPEPRYLY
jgi:phage shock protein C